MGKVHPPYPHGIAGEDRCPHCGSFRPHSFCWDQAPSSEQIQSNIQLLRNDDAPKKLLPGKPGKK